MPSNCARTFSSPDSIVLKSRFAPVRSRLEKRRGTTSTRRKELRCMKHRGRGDAEGSIELTPTARTQRSPLDSINGHATSSRESSNVPSADRNEHGDIVGHLSAHALLWQGDGRVMDLNQPAGVCCSPQESTTPAKSRLRQAERRRKSLFAYAGVMAHRSGFE